MKVILLADVKNVDVPKIESIDGVLGVRLIE